MRHHLALIALLLGACGETEPAPPAAMAPRPAPEAPADDPPPAPEEPAQSSFDPRAPFTFELGRGSGMDGLGTVRILPDGAVTVHEMRQRRTPRYVEHYWVRTELSLDAAQRARLGEMIVRRGVSSMNARYVNRDIMDGSQWLLQLQSEGDNHVSYFSNEFPREIGLLANDLDALLADAGLADATWTEVERAHAGEHDDALWEALYALPEP